MELLQDFGDQVARELEQLEKRYPVPGIVRTGLTKNVDKMKEAIRAAREELSLHGYDPHKRDHLNADISEAAKIDLAGLLVQERENVLAGLEREKQNYERKVRTNRTECDQEIRAAERRLAAMSESELKEIAADMANNPRPVLGEIIDALSFNLKPYAKPEERELTKGLPPDPSTFDGFREVVKTKKLYEAWRHTQEGQTLTRYEAAIDGALKDGTIIPVLRQDGSITGESLHSVLGEV